MYFGIQDNAELTRVIWYVRCIVHTTLARSGVIKHRPNFRANIQSKWNKQREQVSSVRAFLPNEVVLYFVDWGVVAPLSVRKMETQHTSGTEKLIWSRNWSEQRPARSQVLTLLFHFILCQVKVVLARSPLLLPAAPALQSQWPAFLMVSSPVVTQIMSPLIRRGHSEKLCPCKLFSTLGPMWSPTTCKSDPAVPWRKSRSDVPWSPT